MLNNLITVGALFAVIANATLIQNQPRNGVVTLDLGLSGASDLEKRQIGETDAFTSSYFKTIIEVGSNRDQVLVTIDTGSWLTQIPDVSTNCTKCLLPNGKLGLYNSNKSTTAVRTGKSARSTFHANAYYYGEGVLDDIWFGSNFKIPNVLFNDVSDIGSTWPFGLLGLAPAPKGSENENVAWAAYKAGLTSKPITSISATNSSAVNLQLFLGGYSESHLDGDFDWHPIQGTQVYAYVNSFNINGSEIAVNKSSIFDYGNPNIFVSQEVYDVIINSLPFDPNNKKGSRKFDASLLKDKTFTLTIFGKKYTIPALAFIVPGCTGQHCSSVIWPESYTAIGSPILRFLNLAISVEVGNELFGLAPWKSSTTNNVVSF
ncbi:hypothetical protein KGF54_003540 [Candida jiufengensis]|uniref:uncharacterized protein n=1 Tax=Candida jiufengensis TaxID=497108 RepID=UPI00222425A7|nr:uncharacterized protein KGF54_003540 [Candida jiufengensis]KAI5952673.1 hypothetical protein KGF54_003540 [Candida jiufengensis]